MTAPIPTPRPRPTPRPQAPKPRALPPRPQTRAPLPQPRATIGHPDAGQWIERSRRDPTLGELSDADQYTARFGGMDDGMEAWSVEDGEIVDFDPREGGPNLGAYQSLTSMGFYQKL